MTQKRNFCWLAFILCICMLCNSPAQASAIQDKIDSAGEKIDELEDALGRTEENINAYQNEQKILEQDISDGQEKISRLSSELDETKEAIEGAQKAIAKTQEALVKSKEVSQEQYAQMKMRIRFMYENSIGDMLSYILEAGSLPEALRRANYFQAVIDYDRQKLEEYKATTRKIKKAKQDLIAQKDGLEELKTEQSGKLSEIDSAVQDLKVKLSNKLSQIQNSQALRLKYEQDLERQKQYERELERQKAEEDRRREEEIRRQEEELERRRQEQERKRQEEEQKRQEQKQQQQQSNNSPGSGSGVWYDDSSASAGTSDLELLSTLIYCEAGNQPYEGQLAVGSVVMNRVASSSFPNSVSGVIYQSGQFSPVSSGRFAQALAAGLGSQCTSVAQEVLNGKRNVTCLYFRVNTGAIDGLVIGDHVFY